MKTSFANFSRRSLDRYWGCARLAVISQLEYRFNLFLDSFIQPILIGGIEVALWSAIFAGSGQDTIGGYPRESYLSYALWAAFFARAQATWNYEFKMINDVETGSVNSILARPISFYEYYLAQFLGYKSITALVSLVLPFVLTFFISGTTIHSRVPGAVALVFYYLILAHTMSFMIAGCAFFINRAYSFTMAKNIGLWMLTGELFPVDLMPEPYRSWVIALPFSSGVYIPVGYLTGRLDTQALLNGFVSVTVGIVVLGSLSAWLWNAGCRRYSGTGA